MVDVGTLLTYSLVVLGLFLIPGPAVLLTLARAMGGGKRVGIVTGLGIATGDLIHTVMATLGLSAVLATSAAAFSTVKYAGALYLIYLGVRAFLDETRLDGAGSLQLPAARAITAGRAFRQAILSEVLNPKTALFFLAFLPQFVHRENGSVTLQLAVLGAVFVIMSAAYTSVIAAGAGSVGRWLSRYRAIGRWQGRVIGTIYVSLGVRLALQKR
jgi:threonine/homoserine/homoserine lactone efflux protein